MRAPLILLLVAAGVAAVQGRELLQECPIDNCRGDLTGGCVFNTKNNIWKCFKCTDPMLPNPDKSGCVCPAGMYPSTATNKCTVCPKNMYCPKGTVPDADTRIRCPKNMVTDNTGKKSLTDCINAPGYYYRKTATGARAIACARDQYTIGLAKQTNCTACPTDFRTDPATLPGTQTSVAACKAAPGYFVVSEGEAVAPCPRGTFQPDYSDTTSCTECSSLFPDGYNIGISTSADGSTSADACRWLEPGFAFVNSKLQVILDRNITELDVIGGARPCPQRAYCLGGDASQGYNGTVLSCGNGLWTESEGSDSPSDCVSPPGWKFVAPATATDGLGSAVECPDGEYKEGWDRLTTCLSCGLSAAPGNLWRSEQTVVVNELDKNTGLTKKQWRMRGSSDSCYIQRGMGVLRTRALNNGTFFFTAQICGNNTYGIEALRKYGVVSTPCTPCPTGMVTTAAHGTDIKVASVVQAGGSSAALTNTDGKGYFKVNACVTKPGWGYWEGASQMCPKGTYNGGENRLPCTPCLTGTTTAGMGSLADTECTKQSAGYGTVGETVALCPVGTYGLESRDAGVCEDCPDHTWTPAPGATLQYYTNDTTPGCTLCAPGYGDQLLNSSETTQLTGQPTCELCQDGYFGSVTRADTKCELCPVTRSFTYTYMAEDVVVPLATSPAAAKTVDDCIADFSQTVDGAFYVPWDLTNTDLVAKADAQNLHSCIETCRGVGGCAGVHFDYSNDSCWNWEPTTGAGSTYVALKTLPSMIIAQSVIHPWSMGSGMFQFWRGAAVAGAVASGSEVVAPAPNDVADCLLACSTDNLCWGAQIEGWTNTAAATITACTLYKGTVDPGNPNRSLLKASLAKFTP